MVARLGLKNRQKPFKPLLGRTLVESSNGPQDLKIEINYGRRGMM